MQILNGVVVIDVIINSDISDSIHDIFASSNLCGIASIFIYTHSIIIKIL